MKEQLQNILDFEKSIINEYINIFDNYWDFLKNLNKIVIDLGKNLDKEQYDEISPNIWVSKKAIVHNSATIIAPCIIDDYADIRVNAFIRGNVIIGKNCVVGNSSEIKNAVLFDEAKIPHFNYVGDSILGNKAHFGAGAITSNVKSDSSEIIVTLNGIQYNTNMKKVGSIVGDNVEIGCNAVLTPGVVIGRDSNVYPLTMVRGEIDSNKIVKSTYEIVQKIKGKVLSKRI